MDGITILHFDTIHLIYIILILKGQRQVKTKKINKKKRNFENKVVSFWGVDMFSEHEK